MARTTSLFDEVANFADFEASLGGDQVNAEFVALADADHRRHAARHGLARVLAQSRDVDEHFVVESSFAVDCSFQQDCSFEAPLSQSGVLEPGSYTLSVRTFAIAEAGIVCFGFGCSNQIQYNSASDGRASVDLRIVPEPGGTTALASCLALLALLARRRGATRRSA